MLLHLAQKYTTLKSGGGAKQHSTRMKRKTMEPFPSSVFSLHKPRKLYTILLSAVLVSKTCGNVILYKVSSVEKLRQLFMKKDFAERESLGKQLGQEKVES